MKKNERCLAILEILQKQHKVTVTELAEKFDISEMTVRRDLNSLAREYNISRTHGGAELGNQPVVRMISFDEPRIAHKDSKDKIAALAATMIQNGQRIFIDAGLKCGGQTVFLWLHKARSGVSVSPAVFPHSQLHYPAYYQIMHLHPYHP